MKIFENVTYIFILLKLGMPNNYGGYQQATNLEHYSSIKPMPRSYKHPILTEGK